MSEQFVPDDEYVINDLETLKILADPLRLRIIECVSKQATTVKQVAKYLGVSPKKLYYHVNMLEKHGLIVVVDTRVVSGIIEKWYRGRADSFTLERSILMQAEDRDERLDSVLSALFDATRSEIVQAARQGLIPSESDKSKDRTLMLQRSSLNLRPGERAQFTERLQDLIKEFSSESDSADPEVKEYRMTIAFYPLVSPESEEIDESEVEDEEQSNDETA